MEGRALTAPVATDRLVLRRWRDEDRAPFAALNADAETMRFLGGPMPRERSDAMVAYLERHWAERGFGVWAVEAPGVAPLIGAVGLNRLRFDPPGGPAVEILWRLHRDFQGRGYATEAARAAAAWAFARTDLREIVAIAAPANRASIRVMEKLGMAADGFFAHPELPEDHPYRVHALFRLARGAAPG